MEGKKIFSPHKWSFVLLGSGISFFLVLFLLSLIPAILVPEFFVLSGIIFGLLVISYFFVAIAYKKERYEVTEQKITRHYGTIFSDNSIDVKMDRITELSLVLGFVQYTLFKTGTVIVKTAGSSSSKIVLKNIETPEAVHLFLQKMMQKNGYHLTQEKLVQEERPHILGIFGEIFRGAGTAVLFLLYFTWGAFSELRNDPMILQDTSFLLPFVGAGTLVLGLIFFSIIAVKYLDLRKRNYQIFTDAIVYREGFLTKHYSVLPMERVSDSENRQSFLSKLFGLHDVVVSSEGANNNVVFKNMTNGEQMIKNIKFLKNDITLGKKSTTESEAQTKNFVGYTDKTEKPFAYNKDFTGSYKMNPVKTLISSIVTIVISVIILAIIGLENAELMIIPFFIAVLPAIKVLPEMLFTTYSVENSSIDSRYNFMSNKHNAFSVDKITLVKIKESLLDLALGTCSVYFYSIGSTGSIIYKNVKKTPEFEKNILEKVGIFDTEQRKLIEAAFSLMNFLKANIGTAIFFGLAVIMLLIFGFFYKKYFDQSGLAASMQDIGFFASLLAIPALLLAIFLIKFVYQKIFYSKKFYRQVLAESYFESKKGIFFRSRELARVENIKGITTKKYPLTKDGLLSLAISGESAVETGKKQKQTLVFSSLKIICPYIKNVFVLHNYLDSVLLEKKLDKTVKMSSGQDIGNTLLVAVPFALLFVIPAFFVHIGAFVFSLVIVLLILGFIIWTIKVVNYEIQNDRIFKASGIVYRARQTIVFSKFNFIEKNQGFSGKIFKNGNLSVYTLGSGSVDMRMNDVDKFHEMYELLQ